jgi:hypothetical protein
MRAMFRVPSYVVAVGYRLAAVSFIYGSGEPDRLMEYALSAHRNIPRN